MRFTLHLCQRLSCVKLSNRWLVQQPQLSELKERLMPHLPRSYEAMASVINVTRGKLQANFYVDKWPDFSAVVVQHIWPRMSEVADLTVFATSSEALASVLVEGNLISWGKRQLIGQVEEEHTDFLESNVKCTDKEVERFKELYPHFIGKSYYYTSKDFPEKMKCPKGYFLSKLQPRHVETVTQSWPLYHDMPYKRAYVDYLIKHFNNMGMFTEKDPDTPILFTLQLQTGQLGNGYCAVEYRGRGLHSFVKNELTRVALLDGFVTPSTTRLVTAPPPRTETGYTGGNRINEYMLR